SSITFFPIPKSRRIEMAALRCSFQLSPVENITPELGANDIASCSILLVMRPVKPSPLSTNASLRMAKSVICTNGIGRKSV
ncbi:hypothetical protein PFISCL1PPCAC_14016, partial [Pristionchus fissidentatus]